MDVNTVIYNGKKYIELDTIENKDITYAYLINQEDEYDYMIRRVIIENDETYYDPVKDDNEFQIALMLFLKKHNDLLNQK